MSVAGLTSLVGLPLRALRFIKQCGADTASIVSMLLLQLCKATLEALSAILLAGLLTTLLPSRNVSPGWYLQLQAMAGDSLGGLLPMLLLLLALILCKGILSPALAWWRGRLIDQWILLVSMRVFEDELLADGRHHRDNHVQGSNVSVNFMAPRVVMGSVLATLDLLTEVVVAVVLLGFLLVQEPIATLAMSGALVIAVGAVHLLSPRLGAKNGGLQLRHRTSMQRWVTDSLTALREVRLYRLVPSVLERYRPLAKGVARALAQDRTLMDIQSPALEMFFLLILGCATLMTRHHTGEADLHSLALFSALGLRLILGFRRMTFSAQTIRLTHFELEQAASPAPRRETEPAYPVRPVHALPENALLVCDSLHYRYPDTRADVISGLDFRQSRGEWIGLVGESGAGKSTLVDLLIGELHPSQGGIHWQAGHEAIGYIGAFTTLLPGTLRDNVAFLSARYSDRQIMEALGVASIDSLVKRLPEGLDTPVEVFEHRISNGERQRIGLARALLHSSALLILDEATASLDQLTEAHFLKRLRAERADLAVLLITHRLSALAHTDRNLIMVEGSLRAFVMDDSGQVV